MSITYFELINKRLIKLPRIAYWISAYLTCLSKPLILPGALVREGGKTRGVDVGWPTWSLHLSSAKTAAEHKTTARKAERAMIAMTPLLSPPLCCLFCMSTPIGFIVLPLLPSLEYGPPSIMLMLEGGNGGDGGKPIYIYRGPHKISIQKKSHEREYKKLRICLCIYIPR